MSKIKFDCRTEKEFRSDIKLHSIAELHIAIRICQDIYNKTKEWPDLVPNGSDFTGEFIKKRSKVSISPDFKINGFLYEITKSRNVCPKFFHEKKDKVDKALAEGSIIVYVNGYEQLTNPMYCCLGYDELKNITDLSIEKYKETFHQRVGKNLTINRPVYRYDIDWVENLFKPLPTSNLSKIPKQYKDLLKKCDL